MKKTYIKPETTIVALNVRDNVLQAGSITETNVGLGKGVEWSGDGEYNANSREVIKSQDVWEEW